MMNIDWSRETFPFLFEKEVLIFIEHCVEIVENVRWAIGRSDKKIGDMKLAT